MRPASSVKFAARSLFTNKLRTLLAMLGIIIAVWSVICALALGAGAQKSVLDRLSSLGTNLLVVRPAQRNVNGVRSGSYQNLDVEDARALLESEDVTHVAPVVRGTVQAKYYNRNTNTSVLGSVATYFSVRGFDLAAGRLLTDRDDDATARVAVLGSTVAENLFGEADPWCVGQRIAIDGVSYRVIGLLASKGDQGWADPDDQIFIPLSTAMNQVLGVDYLNEIDLQASTQDALDSIENAAHMKLRTRHRLRDGEEDDFNVQNQAEMIETATSMTRILSWLLGGIAGVSLLVGGIGIMNIMLVTVIERTREIGVRKALGAREGDILRQFLIESLIMSSFSGLIGLVSAYVTVIVMGMVQDNFALLVRPTSILIAMSFSLGVGVFFGYYPARRAARMDPIEALRHE